MIEETVMADDTATETTDAPEVTTETVATEASTETAVEPFKLPDDFDWRTHWADGDDKLLKLAGRYASPKALLEANAQLRAKLSSGKVIEPLGDDSTDEEKANFRKAMGIPDAPADYLAKLPDGMVIGEADKPFVDTFLSKMHASNSPQDATNAALDAYYEIIEEQQASHLQVAAEAKKACEDALREEWATPGEYRRNDTILQNYVSALPAGVRDAFDKGYGPDGIPLGYNPEVRRWLVARALEDNPLATIVPGAGANQASAVADEIASIRKEMGTPAYAKDERKQARYRELLDAQARMPK